jgi:hypothetical protein
MSSFRILDASWLVESPSGERGVATGRARCRLCGEKIAKGEPEWLFFASFTDGGSYNQWTAVECHAHESCGTKAGLELNETIYVIQRRRDTL